MYVPEKYNIFLWKFWQHQ